MLKKTWKDNEQPPLKICQIKGCRNKTSEKMSFFICEMEIGVQICPACKGKVHEYYEQFRRKKECPKKQKI